MRMKSVKTKREMVTKDDDGPNNIMKRYIAKGRTNNTKGCFYDITHQ